MSEQIGLQGILTGIKDMLVYTEKDTIDLLKTRMDCSKSMLAGVIKELTPNEAKQLIDIISNEPPIRILDKEAQKAKDELK